MDKKITLLNCDCVEYMAGCEDGAFDLAIVDPPYFEVKGDFDFTWKTFDDYLKDVERWAKELKRIMKGSGSVFWWGNSKRIAYSQVILDKYFHLENSLVWDKMDTQSNIAPADERRVFISRSERLLYYSCEGGDYGAKCDELRGGVFEPIRRYLADEWERAGLTQKDANMATTSQMAGHYFTRTQWALPTRDKYKLLQERANRVGGEYLRKDYEELRKDYEELRRPFNNTLKLTEVLKFSQQSNETQLHEHPTQKAPKLTRALVFVTGKVGGRAFIPFVGSGTEAVECANFGMEVVGCELDPDYYKAACKRFDDETRQEAMF